MKRTICTEEQILAWFPNHSPEVEWNAAEAWIAQRTRWPETALDVDGNEVQLAPPGDLIEAVWILTARFLERRNTPTGIVGMDELGAVRLPGTDRDVMSLIGPYRRVVFG